MSTKKLLLTATFITPLLFVLAGPALAQDQEPAGDPPAATDSVLSSADQEAITTAEDIENGDVPEDADAPEDGDNAAGVPDEVPVLVRADNTPEPPPEGYNPPTSNPPPEVDGPSPNLPRGTAHSWTEMAVEDGQCWIYLNTQILKRNGSVETLYHKYKWPCPQPVSTPPVIDDDPFSAALGLLGGSDMLLDGPPVRTGDDQPPQPPKVDPPHDLPPGTDWVKPGANGVSYEHHTDGSMTIKRDGKVIGQIAPPMSAPKTQTNDGAKPVQNGVKTETGMKPAVSEPTHVGMAGPGKQALVEQDHHTAAAPLTHPADTKIANATKMETAVPHQAMTNGVEHIPEHSSVGNVAGLGHSAGTLATTSLGHGVTGLHEMNLGHTMNLAPTSGLGHMSLSPMAGLGHMGGMSGLGGMHLGGMRMR